MNKLWIESQERDAYLDLFHRARLPELVLARSPEEADIVLADPPRIAPVLDSFTTMAWLQSTFAGVDALVTTPRRDYILTNVQGIFGALMAEYVMGCLINHFRHLPQYREQQNAETWKQLPYEGLAGKHLVLVGAGSIGSHVGRMAGMFGLLVTAVTRSGRPVEGIANCIAVSEMETVLPDADIIVSTLPGTKQTQGLFNRDFFSRCSDAVFINVGRGNVVDEAALLEALEQKQVQHAFLDVFVQEPLPAGNPLWKYPAVTITPHISAHSFPQQVFALFADNYLRWQRGEQLESVVDMERGY
ncbi:D-2-hydroxyacid dehydrogenase [Parasalinivibrio latis]|uniref:D-2-hydroxyacid dehydrogenase n=1 Tax=Parasalinivibrio latis TaxID=2952610 RepID=UPI0030E12E40